MIRVKAPYGWLRNTAPMNRGLRRCASLLALWAMVVLALVPTTGRMWKAAVAPGHELAGVHHHKDCSRTGEPDASAPHTHEDCAYCALASGLAAAGLMPPYSPAWIPPPAPDTRGVAAARAAPPRSGLGARGPPRFV